MNIWKVILATLVIFITGVVTGGLLVGFAERAARAPHANRQRGEGHTANNPTPGTSPQREPGRGPNPANLPNRLRAGINLEFLEKLDSEVHLTAGQRERIEEIVADGQLRNKRIWDNVAPDIRRENMETQRRIREALTPDQLTRFEELMKQTRPLSRPPRDQKSPQSAPDNAQPAPK